MKIKIYKSNQILFRKLCMSLQLLNVAGIMLSKILMDLPLGHKIYFFSNKLVLDPNLCFAKTDS